jgi:hypothetical protein
MPRSPSKVVKKPGSEPIRDWGRDIGEPCPSKENSEVDPNSDYNSY